MSVEAPPGSDLTLLVIPAHTPSYRRNGTPASTTADPVTLILAVPQDFMDAYRRGRPA